MTPEQAKALRDPFPPEQVGKLPKPTKKNAEKGTCRECGGWHGLPAVHLDYVGHAAVTARLLAVDPEWVWQPDLDAAGRWDVHRYGSESVLTGTLTIGGITRPCVGTAPTDSFELLKQLQSDAIRNGAMRFGVALDLWSKEDLTTVDPADPDTIAGIVEALNGIVDDDDRKRIKRLYVDLFDAPDRLSAELAAQAVEWVDQQIAAQADEWVDQQIAALADEVAS